MAYNTKPTLTMVFTGETKTINTSFRGVKETPIESDIKVAAAALDYKFKDDDTATFTYGYYTTDSIVAEA